MFLYIQSIFPQNISTFLFKIDVTETKKNRAIWHSPWALGVRAEPLARSEARSCAHHNEMGSSHSAPGSNMITMGDLQDLQ